MAIKTSDIRLKVVWAAGAAALVALAVFAPLALQALALVLAKMTGGAILGYWVDRGVFPYARPSGSIPNPDWIERRARCILVGMAAAALAV